MAATPTDPLVRTYLRLRRDWSDHHHRVAISILNRYTAWLAARATSLVDATRDDIAEYLAGRAATGIAGSTLHKDYQHLRWLYAWLVEDGEIDSRHDLGPMRGIKPPKVSAPDPTRTGYITDAEYATIMAGFDRRLTLDCRNAALCSLMYWSGLRRSEIVRADLDRLDMDQATLEVLGKNGRWRRVPLAAETVMLLERYLRRRATDPATALFASSMGALEADTSGRLLPNAISVMLYRRCDKLGLRQISPHQFRRAMAIESGRRGLAPNSICTVAGWSDNRMLMRYQRAAAEQLAADDFRAHDTSAPRRRRLRAV